MHNCQPNLTATRILTTVIRGTLTELRKAVAVNVVITHRNYMEYLSSWQVYVFFLKIFPIYIKQH